MALVTLQLAVPLPRMDTASCYLNALTMKDPNIEQDGFTRLPSRHHRHRHPLPHHPLA